MKYQHSYPTVICVDDRHGTVENYNKISYTAKKK